MVKMITILKHRLMLLYRWLSCWCHFAFNGFEKVVIKFSWRFKLLLLVAAVFKVSTASVFFLFLILSTKFFVAFLYISYSISDIDVIFVIPIPQSLICRDKSWHSSSLHVLPSNRDVINSCRMTFSMGGSRWLMLGMVRIMKSNFCLKADLKAQYAACG